LAFFQFIGIHFQSGIFTSRFGLLQLSVFTIPQLFCLWKYLLSNEMQIFCSLDYTSALINEIGEFYLHFAQLCTIQTKDLKCRKIEPFLARTYGHLASVCAAFNGRKKAREE